MTTTPAPPYSYYASRGETPLAWGGSGAGSLGLSGAVDGCCLRRHLRPRRGRPPDQRGAPGTRPSSPGMELVIAAHKSVAELGVIGRAEHMHAIMDAERDATLAYLDAITIKSAGDAEAWPRSRRRPRASSTPTPATPPPTSGDPGPISRRLLRTVCARRPCGRARWRHRGAARGRLRSDSCGTPAL